MKPLRPRVPSTDGGLLAEPPLSRAGGMPADNAVRLGRWDHDFQGRCATRLRPMVRKQVLSLSREFLSRGGLEPPDAKADGPLVVTGHQPELFHPGVWVKNFAVAAIARAHQAVGLNLIVDNDIPKSSSIHVPRLGADGELEVARIAFDEWRGEVPYEDLTVADEATFASFRDRVRQSLPAAIDDPLIDEFWPRAVGARGLTNRIGVRFALARRGIEESWGAHNHEAPLSAVCETEGFLWFACHILARLPAFQEIHNDALRRHRAVRGIRSRHHPVPALGCEKEWLEAPFWVWRAGVPRRRPLLVRLLPRAMELRIGGEDEPIMELPLAVDREACCAVEQLMNLPARGVRLRTRALTTTMFARYLLGDLFLHGIGGAKYDELGDEISGRFLGFEPPAYLTTSMTLWLGVGEDPTATRERLAATGRAIRDLSYNCERFIDMPPTAEAARWIDAKRAAIAGPVESHAQRRARFQEIRRCNAALERLVESRREEIERERARLAAGIERNTLARSREYSIVLHSQRRIRAALAAAVPGAMAATA